MIKKITQLKRRKGFTLVECIVAIAVFALLTAVILMILANAQNQTVKSKESEEDLNNLIENVVGDDTYKKYGANSKTLSLNLSSGGTFDITYDTVAGYKNYIKCNHQTGTDKDGNPIYCGYVGNNTEFMNGKNIKDFVDAGDKYVCPKCAATIAGSDFQLKCEACWNEGDYDNTDLFTISSATGSYTCVKCGSGSVKGADIEEAITADSDFMVSGLTANSIRYGKVKRPAETKTLIESDGGSGRVTIEYKANENLIIPGVYKMTFDGANPTYIKVYLPPWYKIGDLKYSSGSLATAVQSNLANNSYILIEPDPDGHSVNLPYVTIEFTLTNYKNGYSFDYDYRTPFDDDDDASTAIDTNAYGLIGYWFRLNGRSTTRMGSTDIIKSDSVTKYYPDDFYEDSTSTT